MPELLRRGLLQDKRDLFDTGGQERNSRIARVLEDLRPAPGPAADTGFFH
ncbi:hypothetical protein [Dichotomicrobium thermohalophilum]|nr:hypothetical protein [Dichotomicrobium thermohalophilum]